MNNNYNFNMLRPIGIGQLPTTATPASPSELPTIRGINPNQLPTVRQNYWRPEDQWKRKFSEVTGQDPMDFGLESEEAATKFFDDHNRRMAERQQGGLMSSAPL